MALALYLDHQVPRAITLGLRLRGVDVLTAFEDGASTLSDPALLDRATALNRVLFSQATDLLIEPARRQATGQRFAGVVYAHPVRIAIGTWVEESPYRPEPEIPLICTIRCCFHRYEAEQRFSTLT